MTTAPSDMSDTDDGALALRQEQFTNALTILPAASLPTLLQAEGADLLEAMT